MPSDPDTPRAPRLLSKNRMEGFSDGVFGFAITLLVVDLAVRPPGTPLQQVLHAWPSYLAYLTSFLTIGGHPPAGIRPGRVRAVREPLLAGGRGRGTAEHAAKIPARRHRVRDRDYHRAASAGSGGGALRRSRGVFGSPVPGGRTGPDPAS